MVAAAGNHGKQENTMLRGRCRVRTAGRTARTRAERRESYFVPASHDIPIEPLQDRAVAAR